MKQEIIRKLSAAVAMSLVVGVSLAACGGSSSSTAAGVTKTGSAEGFGGAVTATLTVDANGTVTDCKLEGAQETESIGGAALEELSKQVVAANGPAIDGVAGATVTTKAVRKAVAAALGVELAEEAPADSAAAAPAEPAAIVPVEGGIQIGQAYAAAHGTKCFTEAVAVVKDDVILAAYLDDFQFTSTDAGVTAVPNSDSDFAAGYAEGKVLMSKRANADYYSKMMAEKGGSTVALDANFDAIQNFAVGKTISELEDVAAKGAEAVDAVSGATLVDTAGYLSAIVDAAKNAQTTQAVEFNGSSEDLKLNVVYGAAHGTKCFTSGAVATAGDTIVLSYIDEFQFAGSDAGVVGVPNSDSDFGAGYAEGKVLMSKRVNADYYSKMMAEKAGSTVSLDANYDAIQNHVNGMSIADAEALSKDEKAVDAVSGATLVDTAGYVGVLVGFDKEGNIIDYSLLSHAETPGLGSKAADWFKKGAKGDITGMNPGQGALVVNKDGGQIDAITASTITTRAFLKAVNNAYAAYSGQNVDGASGATQQVSETVAENATACDAQCEGNEACKQVCDSTACKTVCSDKCDPANCDKADCKKVECPKQDCKNKK